MQEFLSEDDFQTFEVWLLRDQAIDPATIMPEELGRLRRLYEDIRKRSATSPKVGRMKLPWVPGEHRYAVAVREGSDLWLMLWVRRSPQGQFFIMVPRIEPPSTPGTRPWNPHTSYHLKGDLHIKSHNRKIFPPQKRQPLTGVFRGSEHLGVISGFFPKGVGAICEPTDFSGVVEVAPGVLGPYHGVVAVDLVEPGHEPIRSTWTQIVTRQVFRDSLPWVVITVGSSS